MNRTFAVKDEVQIGTITGKITDVDNGQVGVEWSNGYESFFCIDTLNAILDAVEQPKTFDQIPTDQPTLRDQFAMAALTAASKKWDSIQNIVVTAYEIADAMILERNKTNNNENI